MRITNRRRNKLLQRRHLLPMAYVYLGAESGALQAAPSKGGEKQMKLNDDDLRLIDFVTSERIDQHYAAHRDETKSDRDAPRKSIFQNNRNHATVQKAVEHDF